MPRTLRTALARRVSCSGSSETTTAAGARVLDEPPPQPDSPHEAGAASALGEHGGARGGDGSNMSAADAPGSNSARRGAQSAMLQLRQR